MRQPLLSVIIPVYNEENTILSVIQAVKQKARIKSLEIIVVDDCSQDHTWQILQKHKKEISFLIRHSVNRGKGAAIRTGLAKASGQIVVIQDADLEYDPANLKALIQPILNLQADAVFGSRFISSEPRRVLYFWHFIANQLLTLLTNLIANLNISDMETGYKAIKRELFLTLPLSESRFGIEPEITVRLAQAKARIYEVGVSYHGRSYEEGKKIQLSDAFTACWVIIKIAWFSPWPKKLLNKKPNLFAMAVAAPWRIVNELQRILLSPFARFQFWSAGIAWRKGFKIYGLPILQIWSGSKISIKENFELRSAPRSNPLAPNHPVVLSTRSSQAKISIGSEFGMTGGSIVAEKEILIGDRVLIGANSLVIDTDFHPLSSQERLKTPLQGKTNRIVIEDDVFVGTNSIILKGSHLHRGCVIGAGSVVSGDIPADCIAAGNPAKVIKKIVSLKKTKR
jgi:glycosyltransferase involved in cell wall biosynthesis/carbonic anhydrase/acetyltransferase-like protein (isoleucine patch superfamily)